MWLDGIEQEHLHRELAIAILDSAWAAPGRKRRFAAQVGITPQYLSYLCDPLDPRLPSPALIERLAAALPGDTALRGRLRAHWQAVRAGWQAVRPIGWGADTADTLAVALPALRAAREAATFVPDPVVAARQYRSVRDGVAALLPTVAPARYPLDFCELCILAHDAECVLNAADRALWYARQAQVVLSALQTRAGRVADPRCVHYAVNIPAAVAVAYTNLGLPQPALAAYEAAARWDVCRSAGCRVLAAPSLSRPAAHAGAGCPVHPERRGGVGGPGACPLRTARGRGGCALAGLAGGDRRAGLPALRQSAQGGGRAGQPAGAGGWAGGERPASSTIVRKTVAGLHWAQGDRTAWAYWIGQALTLGQSAQLTHQVAGIRRTYGAAVGPILAEMIPSGTAETE